MLHYLSEDPWPLASGFGLVALGFLLAVQMTQQGKYLIRAGIAAGMALLVLGVEYLWVTDNERIEAVVYELGRAAKASDGDLVISHLAPEVVVATGDNLEGRVLSRFDSRVVVASIREQLQNARFDTLNISKLHTNAGSQTRRGTAEFVVFATGTYASRNARFATPVKGMEWSLGFRETSPKVWKVTRITPVNPPPMFRSPIGFPSD
jgi:hypothetical protein